MPKSNSIASSSSRGSPSSSASRNRIYLAVWLVNNNVLKYGFIIAQKTPTNRNVLGYVFNRHSCSQDMMKSVRNDQLAGAMLLGKVEAESEREMELKAYLSRHYQERKNTGDEKVTVSIALEYLFENRYIKETGGVSASSVIRDLETALYCPKKGIIVQEMTRQLSLRRGHGDKALPVWDIQGLRIDSEIPAMSTQPLAGSKPRKDAFSKHRVDY